MNSISRNMNNLETLMFAPSVHRVFRFEALPKYVIPEEAAPLAQFRNGKIIEWPSDYLEYVSDVRDACNRGQRQQRLRVVDSLGDDYFRFESAFYSLLKEAGMDIRVLLRSELGSTTFVPDVYLFDDTVGIELMYDAVGAYETERVIEQGTLKKLQMLRDNLWDRAELI